MKKTTQQRKDILLTAWPNMSTTHRPDIDAWKMKNDRTSKSKEDTYYFPYINLEDLTKPRLLLLFFNSRGRNPPNAFANADLRATHFDRYGELISWDDHPDASQWLFTGRGVHPGHGLWILQVQERLYRFLVDCCKHIVHDIPAANLTNLNQSIQPEPPSLSSNSDDFISLTITATEAPYRLPAHLNFRRLESLIEAKLSEAEDYIWSLREDLGYSASAILEWKEHRRETMLDTRGHRHPDFNPTPSTLFWNRVIVNVTSWAFSRVEIWGRLRDMVAELCRLQTVYADDISPDKDLPEPYKSALLSFYFHLTQFVKGSIGSLKTGFIPSPPIRPCFVREPQEPHSTIIRMIRRTNLTKIKGREDLIWIFMTLFDERQLHIAGLNTLMDELERLTESDNSIKDLVSPLVADFVSELALFSQCLYQIELYQPWAATLEHDLAENDENLKAEYVESQRPIAGYVGYQLSPRIVELGTPAGDRFRYPIDKRRARQNVESMIAAEKQLDSFWNALDLQLNGAGRISPRLKALLRQRMLHRTPEWQEPQGKSSTSAVTEDEGTVLFPLSSLGFHVGEDTGRYTFTQFKVKPKTRGAAHPIQEAEKSDEVTPSPRGHKFTVDKRAFKVFNTLFYTPTVSSQPGTIAWADFLYALAALGFTAEKLYGSVWQFHPTKLDVERSINIHEPHPSGKIPFTTAKRHGRRPNRAYGLHTESFVLS
ncbi:hypothetical protein M501DRAFT_1023066 [Patellaria atrata CBS 101060]|uniref:Uncharacterized protein n=1 Tax=Patellaria atrata CBS 101060 TaxID=1346257 RepID=A0A9P4SF57_9PEZI|nr:hypothetical protein M501DRAFT_1023066 [Patellaria atrata CBS 101060]